MPATARTTNKEERASQMGVSPSCYKWIGFGSTRLDWDGLGSIEKNVYFRVLLETPTTPRPGPLFSDVKTEIDFVMSKK